MRGRARYVAHPESPATDTVAWMRSSYCSDHTCVEVAMVDGRIALRDSKNTALSPIMFTVPEWNSFIRRVSEEWRSL